MEERDPIGMEARSPGGEVIGRISGVLADEAGEATHYLIDTGEEELEVPTLAVDLDADADFATFYADASDAEPGDHLSDEANPEGYAPAEPISQNPLDDAVDDSSHEGQFVEEAGDPEEVPFEEERATEDWQDEEETPVESGYPRTDAYIDPETGEDVVDPLLKDNETLGDDVEDLISDTDLSVVSAREGVVELSGSVERREDLEGLLEEVMGLDGVLEVDTSAVDVGRG